MKTWGYGSGVSAASRCCQTARLPDAYATLDMTMSNLLGMDSLNARASEIACPRGSGTECQRLRRDHLPMMWMWTMFMSGPPCYEGTGSVG